MTGFFGAFERSVRDRTARIRGRLVGTALATRGTTGKRTLAAAGDPGWRWIDRITISVTGQARSERIRSKSPLAQRVFRLPPKEIRSSPEVHGTIDVVTPWQ